MPNYTCIFLDFVRGFCSYVKGLLKTKHFNSVLVSVEVWYWIDFGVICEMAYSADSIITEIAFSQCKRATTPKISKPELQF